MEYPGGVQFHILDFAEELMERGHYVQVLAPGRRTKDMPLWVQTTGTSFSIPFNGSVAHLSFFGTAGMRVRRWIRQGKFDIVHLHEPEVPSLPHKALRPGFSHPPYVATFHASFDTYPKTLETFENYLRNRTAAISQAICVSPSSWRIAQHYLDPSIPVHIIPNGVQTRYFADAEPNPAWQGTTSAPTIGFLGRMGEERKGFRVFAEAMRHILKFYPHARFLCAGDGEDAARKILASIDPTLENHVEFLGRISDDDKARFYKSLTLYIAPQTGGESFGIVLVEAMAAGCPVVASDLEAFKDVSDNGKAANLFLAGQSKSLAQNVIGLLANKPVLDELGQKGRERSLTYEWDRVDVELLDVYARALSDAGTGDAAQGGAAGGQDAEGDGSAADGSGHRHGRRRGRFSARLE
ncbi:MAG: glycosyltransferase family 4 protein [Bifidobacteriaceae bacterium]|nr:glycosyltransferase family 4 protein [Bifidobacteriaceae bacterium]